MPEAVLAGVFSFFGLVPLAVVRIVFAAVFEAVGFLDAFAEDGFFCLDTFAFAGGLDFVLAGADFRFLGVLDPLAGPSPPELSGFISGSADAFCESDGMVICDNESKARN